MRADGETGRVGRVWDAWHLPACACGRGWRVTCLRSLSAVARACASNTGVRAWRACVACVRGVRAWRACAAY